MDLEEFLEHHGIKGQKWGIENNRISTSIAARRTRSSMDPSEDAKNAKALKSKPTHTLSNKDLKTLNERTNLEQNYKRMNPSSVTSGVKWAKAIMGTAAFGATAYNMAVSPSGKAAIAAGKKFLGK